MGLKTTVIGSYPKPDYCADVPDWFKLSHSKYTPAHWNEYKLAAKENEVEGLQRKAIEEVVKEQADIGIDVITDGEIPRENYIFHFCRKLNGIDFEDLRTTVYRNGACSADLPTIIGPVTPKTETPWCVEEWKLAQNFTNTPVKITLPGPMTIMNTTAHSHSIEKKDLSLQLVKCINREVRALAAGGCKFIQIDEPLLVRLPDVALDYGIEHLALCFEGLGSGVQKAIHLCCGYPTHLDEESYLKADRGIYHQIAETLDNAVFDAVSIEDAHQHNDLSLLEKFKKTDIIFGVVAIAKSRVETVEEIKSRVQEALKHIPAERLWLAPDCGLGFLPRDILRQKLKNMVTAAKSV